MAVDTNLASLFEKLKLENPYLPPRPWESIPSESGIFSSSSSDTNGSSHVQYSTSSVSESILVRLALDALQGLTPPWKLKLAQTMIFLVLKISWNHLNVHGKISQRSKAILICRAMPLETMWSERVACDSSLPYRSEELLQTLDNQITNSCQNTSWLPDCFPGDLLNNDRRSSKTTWLHAVEIEPEISSCRFGVQLRDNVDSSGSVLPRNPSLPEAYEKDQHPNRACTFLSSTSLPSWQLKHHSDFFSMNPILTRNSLNPKRDSEQMFSRDSREPYPFFDFTSIKDPCEVYIEKFAAGFRDQLGAEVSVLTSTAATSDSLTSHQHNLKDCSDEKLEKKAELSHTCSPKCLLEEILLQYKYLSKLTIKLLEEGFNLQEHLLALRRYHFMELADWAHLFVISLQHHKWYTIEAEKRISEIQGILELSFQLEEHCTESTPLIFLGLGYRVDWPLNIILSPGALRIYSDIFSFLMQVKFAVFSLSDVWRSLKDLSQLNKKNQRFVFDNAEPKQLSILIETRHQFNHFVSMLQRYVQSQLLMCPGADVSPYFDTVCGHQVKDMMDLHSAHMAYLNDSLHICFLSEESQHIASIIRSILQSAVDFRSCLNGDTSQGNKSTYCGKSCILPLPRLEIRN
ncbi:hypothetical protein K7X08_027898 [Anisodus acutangulus]|uniref:Gamma-tubulin complex component n=1 Tax=Anisodus acutangulus TaxID=402998 RepID=A0A9Q1RQV2_9SOLA|nr:hypothetical protein K7X08_027898 [Anisodus acutangulus]